jgi:hypothetical protein
MDFNSLSNMKLSDFENIGKVEYNKGFKTALETVVKLLDGQICEDFKADDVCEHPVCKSNATLAEGLMNVKNNIG